MGILAIMALSVCYTRYEKMSGHMSETSLNECLVVYMALSSFTTGPIWILTGHIRATDDP